MTIGSINLRPETELIALPGVNEVIAEKLAAANISSTADLVTADAAKVAETSGISESTIANLIAAAKVADRSTIDLSSVPTISSQAANLKKKFKVKTVSDLAGKSPSEIAAAFGGDETKAAAVIAGAKIALGKAIRG
jgi:predicted RecB family nuclease